MSAGSSPGSEGETVPSPNRELARPLEWKYQGVGVELGGGQSSNSCQASSPMTKRVTGESRTPVQRSFRTWSNQASCQSSTTLGEAACDACPTSGFQGMWYQGPMTSFWDRLASSLPACARREMKFLMVPLRKTSYQPAMWSPG